MVDSKDNPVKAACNQLTQHIEDGIGYDALLEKALALARQIRDLRFGEIVVITELCYRIMDVGNPDAAQRLADVALKVARNLKPDVMPFEIFRIAGYMKSAGLDATHHYEEANALALAQTKSTLYRTDRGYRSELDSLLYDLIVKEEWKKRGGFLGSNGLKTNPNAELKLVKEALHILLHCGLDHDFYNKVRRNEIFETYIILPESLPPDRNFAVVAKRRIGEPNMYAWRGSYISLFGFHYHERRLVPEAGKYLQTSWNTDFIGDVCMADSRMWGVEDKDMYMGLPLSTAGMHRDIYELVRSAGLERLSPDGGGRYRISEEYSDIYKGLSVRVTGKSEAFGQGDNSLAQTLGFDLAHHLDRALKAQTIEERKKNFNDQGTLCAPKLEKRPVPTHPPDATKLHKKLTNG